jgi:hypothetical protein
MSKDTSVLSASSGAEEELGAIKSSQNSEGIYIYISNMVGDTIIYNILHYFNNIFVNPP